MSSEADADDLGALSEVKASSLEESSPIQLTLAEVLKELRDCNAQLLQKLDRLEDRVTSELQGLRKPEAAPRLGSDQSFGPMSPLKVRRNSEHSLQPSGSSSQTPRRLGTAKEALEMDIGQMIPAYLGGTASTSLKSIKKLKKKTDIEIAPDPPCLVPDAPAFDPVVLDTPGATQTDAPGLSPRVSFQKPATDPTALSSMRSLPIAGRRSSNSELADAPRKAFSNPEEPIMVSMISARSNRFCPSSEKLNQAIFSGNLTEVFRVQEGGLMEAISPRNQRNEEEEKEFWAVPERLDTEEDPPSQDWQESQSRWLWLSPLHTFLARFASKALGLMPLFDVRMDEEETLRLQLRRMVSRLYHWLVLLSLIVAAGLETSRYTSDITDEDFDCGGLPPLTTDLGLMISACMVLSSWGGFWSYKETTDRVASSSQDLADCCEMIHLDRAWKIWSCADALLTLLLWVGLLAGRVVVSHLSLQEQEVRKMNWLQSFVPFAVSTGILAVASFWQVRTSHAMTLIINEWSGNLLRGQSSAWQLKGAWRLISGLFRKTSRTFQYCYAALCATIVLVAFTAINDARRELVVASLANLAVALLLPGVLVILASTTTACRRLPSLVTLVEPNDAQQETDFMELTLFLSFSECGFFVWDTSVTVGLVQKFLYFTLAVAGTMGFQSGAFRLS